MSSRETAELLLLVGRLVQAGGYDGELSPAQWMALRFGDRWRVVGVSCGRSPTAQCEEFRSSKKLVRPLVSRWRAAVPLRRPCHDSSIASKGAWHWQSSEPDEDQVESPSMAAPRSHGFSGAVHRTRVRPPP